MSVVIESKIGGIACTGRYGEALAWCIFCIRARKNPHADNVDKRQRAYCDMLHAGWQPEELDALEERTVEHGVYGLETMYK